MQTAARTISALLNDPSLSETHKVLLSQVLVELSYDIMAETRQFLGSQQSRFINIPGRWLTHEAGGFQKCANG